jgi:transcriptional regulator with XRE-family HTH domain
MWPAKPRIQPGAVFAMHGQSAMSERDTFGPRLRRERERRGISLETIATLTNVSIELWQGFESNDLSRWPKGVFARAFVRDYAKAVGLDANEVVDDFCRLFPLGDRRVVPLIREQARLIGHEPAAADDPSLIPGGVDRRGAEAGVEPPPSRLRLVPRLVRAIFHT